MFFIMRTRGLRTKMTKFTWNCWGVAINVEIKKNNTWKSLNIMNNKSCKSIFIENVTTNWFPTGFKEMTDHSIQIFNLIFYFVSNYQIIGRSRYLFHMGNLRIWWHSCEIHVREQIIKSVTQIKRMNYIQKIIWCNTKPNKLSICIMNF